MGRKRDRVTRAPKLIKRTSRIHGTGVYAGEAIPKNTRIIEYRGRRLLKRQTEYSRSRYLFDLNRQTDIVGQNLARYINHSCEPNCEAEIDGREVWIVARRKIAPGEELTYNYGYRLDEELMPCRCGAKRCVGYVLRVEDWPKVRKMKRTRRGAPSRSRAPSSPPGSSA